MAEWVAHCLQVVGIVLKSLGASANARDFDREVPGGRQAVVDRYLQLRQQVSDRIVSNFILDSTQNANTVKQVK
jgi:hypothetical protein